MMKIIQKLDVLPKADWDQPGPPTMIVLHDTAGPTLSGAVTTLKQRGLGYHAIIDKDGTVYQYYDWDEAVNHAFHANKQTVGLSMVGGGGTPLSQTQVNSVIDLINFISAKFSSVTKLTSHKEIDIRHEKIDPEFNDFGSTMDDISNSTGLTRVKHIIQ